MTTVTDPLIERAVQAQQQRYAAFEAAEQACSKARQEANANFAAEIRQLKTDGASLSAICRGIGISRQALHGILNKNT